MRLIDDRLSNPTLRRTVLAGALGLSGVVVAAESAVAARPKDMGSAGLAAAADIVLITNALNLYGLAVDSQQWSLFDKIFAPDVYARYGSMEPYTDLAKFKTGFASIHAPLERSQHAVMGHVIDVTGDTAQTFCYSAFRLTRKSPDGERASEGQGFYNDELIRTKAGWLIKRRIAGIVWRGQAYQKPIDESLYALRHESLAGNVPVIRALLGR